MVDGISEDKENMKMNFNCEAMETGRAREEVKRDGDKIIEEQSEKPAWKVNNRGMQADEIQENKSLQMFNEDEKKLYKYENSTDKGFEFNLQLKLKLLKDAVREEKRSMMQFQVQRKSINVLYIDYRSGKTKPEFIDNALSKVDNKVQVRHHWKRHFNKWEGTVAVFETIDKAFETQRRLSNSGYLTVVNMQDITRMLIEAEVRYHDSEDSGSILIIRRRKPVSHCLKRWMEGILKEFGEILNIEFGNPKNPGEVCRAMYRFSSHAILAKLILEQDTVRKIGKVSAEIIMTEKDKHILGYVRNYFRHT